MNNKQAFKKRSHDFLKRRVRKLELVQRFLIVCEGKKTEPNYFKNFRVPKNVTEVNIYGLGYNTVRLVEETVELKRQEDYDQVWCVFDRNSHPAQYFNNAIALAYRHGIKIGYSNQSFELWYLLHFHYCDTAIERADCQDRLGRLLGHKYEKNSETIYNELKHLQPQAIQNAKRLLSQYASPNPERDNPSTTVHLLVEQLNKFIR